MKSLETFLKKILFLIFLDYNEFITLKYISSEVLTETSLVLNLFMEYLSSGDLYTAIFIKKTKFIYEHKI